MDEDLDGAVNDDLVRLAQLAFGAERARCHDVLGGFRSLHLLVGLSTRLGCQVRIA